MRFGFAHVSDYTPPVTRCLFLLSLACLVVSCGDDGEEETQPLVTIERSAIISQQPKEDQTVEGERENLAQ
jgi:hypothetical protein